MKSKILTILFLLLFLSGAGCLGYYGFQQYQSAKIAEEMKETAREGEKLPIKEESEKNILPQFTELYQQNSEFAGWIQIEDTVIDYPVMKPKEDNKFYLTHGADGSSNQLGAIYMDVVSDLESTSTNWILYGHNFRNGSMFGSLKKYKDEKYYVTHPLIKFDTLYEEGIYEIIAVFPSKVYRKDEDIFKYYKYTTIQSEEEFQEYVSNIKKMSIYEIPTTAAYGDTLLTLSTCDEWTENGRIAIVAKKIQK